MPPVRLPVRLPECKAPDCAGALAAWLTGAGLWGRDAAEAVAVDRIQDLHGAPLACDS